MPSLPTRLGALALGLLISGAAAAQSAYDRGDSRSLDGRGSGFDRALDGRGGGLDRRPLDIYEPPALNTRRVVRSRRSVSRVRVSARAVPPWWVLVDEPRQLRVDRRAAWYFGLPEPYQYRRYQ